MTGASQLPPVLVQAHAWRRLDPLMLLVHPVHELVRFFPLVVATVLFGSSGNGGGPWEWIGIGIPIALGVLRFVTTRYRVTGEQVELQRGLLSRRILTARLDRVRTVELTASPIHRLLRLAKVDIGTGSAARQSDDRLELDALGRPEAERLRSALLRRAQDAVPDGAAPEQPPGGSATAPADVVLLRLDPRWARYAPLTTSGLVIAAAIAAGVSQLLQVTGDRAERTMGSSLPDLTGVPLAVWLPLGVVVALLVFSVLAVLGYLVTNGGFRLSVRGHGQAFHVVRGLLTTRETTLERERVRGVALHEPLGLRLGGAAWLSALVTGLDHRSRGSAPLTPAAPRSVVDGVGASVLGGSTALTADLRQHGPRALRRRYVRAVSGLGLPLVLVAVLAATVGGAWRWALLPALLVLALAEPLARDRYRRLGHGLDDRFLVVSSGTLSGRRQVLERDGIIGWNLRQTWFQRRAGLCDLVATTSAGRQAVTALDVPVDAAVAVADAAVPGLLTPFRMPR